MKWSPVNSRSSPFISSPFFFGFFEPSVDSRKMKSVLFAGVMAALVSETYAARPLPFVKRASTGASFSMQRGTGLGSHRSSKSTAAQGSPLADTGDFLYLLNITLGGQPFTCQIDTGSSDLWVIPPDGQPVKTVNHTEVAVGVTYADESGVSGFIDFAELAVGGYTIPSQAFINPNTTKNVAQLLGGLDSGMNCLIGLSFDLLSEVNNNIVKAFGNTTIGQTPLSNIFDQNPTLPNSLDIHLQRSSDLEYTDKGLLLIGEHSKEHGDITKQPQLLTVTETRWTVEVDAIHLNGDSLSFNKSAIPALKNSTKLGGIIDSGSSNLILPYGIASAIFDQIPESIFVNEDGFWFVDCMSSANVSITMGGVEYPVHPLDLTRIKTIELPVNGTNENITFCQSAVEIVGNACGDECDMIMGDVFLRNAVASFTFGNWTQAATPNDGSFIQLLPLTNQSKAWSDFLVTRATNLKSFPRAPPITELFSILSSQADSSNSTDSSGPSTPSASASSSSPSSSSNSSNSESHSSADSSNDDSKAKSDDLPIANSGTAKSALADGITSTDNNFQLVSLVEKYGPVIIGLLAGNIFIGVVLVAVGIATCMRRQGGKSRNIGPSYAPVRFKEADSGVESTYHD